MKIKEKKQIKAIQDQGHVEKIKKCDGDNDDDDEIFNKLVDKRHGKILN